MQPTIESIIKDLVAVTDILGKRRVTDTWLRGAAFILEIAARDLRKHADAIAAKPAA